MKKAISIILVAVLCLLLPAVTLNVNAAEAQSVVSLATQQVGGEWPNGWCLAYIATIFNQSYGLDGNLYSSCCSYQNGNRFIDSTSRSNIPIGACVYFGGSNVACSCGNYAGHVAIHIGNDNIVHAWDGRIVCTSIDYVISCGYPYRGYGWYADLVLSEVSASYATITEGNYALKNTANGTYAVVENNADVTGQIMVTSETKAGFAISKSATTEGYALRALCSSNKMMNVYTEYVTSGNVVCLWDDTGDASQRWYFEEVSGGYVIRSVQTPSCVLDIREDGAIFVSTYTGASSQVWTLEKCCAEHIYSNNCDTSCNYCGETRTITHSYAAATCTKAKTCKVCGATSGSALGHKYTNACDTSCNTCGAVRTVTHNYAAATCTEAKTCKVCGATSGSALGHQYSNSCDTTCNTCGAIRTITHSSKTTTTKATLSEDGYTVEKCTVCGKVTSETTIHCVETIRLSKSAYTYNGKVKTPGVIVKDSEGNTLQNGTDYTVTYASGRKNAGTYKVTVKMIGNYTGEKTLTFKIKPIDIDDCSVKLSKTSYTYNGKVKTPSVTVKNAGGTTLKKGTHYTVTYASGRKNAGTYKVTVKMMGNYTGTKTLTFKIKPIDIDDCSVKLSAKSYTYNGKVKTPSVTVKNAGGTTLKKGKHYTVTYEKGRKNVGTYDVTVTMKGNYSGEKTLTFKINPKKTTVKKLTSANDALKVSIDKETKQVTGYQVQYSTSKTFKKATTKTVKSYKTTSLTLKKLKSDKKYYVRVRTYKTVDGTRYYSGWSSYKTARTK